MDPIAVQQKLLDIQSSSASSHQQDQSPLFAIIPPEIRSQIFSLALTQCEDTSIEYDQDTCYKRPGYLAPKKTYTDLLRTCKRVYHEAWFMPWSNAEHVFYFAWDSRKPPGTIEPMQMHDHLWRIFELRDQEPDEIEYARIFAQLCELEHGNRFRHLCDIAFFKPRRMSITIRHTDFWNWESNQPMRIRGDWIQQASLPDSVREVSIDFESTIQRQDQVDFLADKAASLWYFKRKDDALLVADPEEKISMRWSGSSTWEGQRWTEYEARPNEIDYYVRTIKFKIQPELDEDDLKDHDQGARISFVQEAGIENDGQGENLEEESEPEEEDDDDMTDEEYFRRFQPEYL